MTILLFLIILAVLILAHEFGHFLFAKFFGIRVDEFGLGFPPKLFGKKYGETEYTLNALPIGGFVRIFGENPDEEPATHADKKRNFAHKPKSVQAAVLAGGVFFNLLLAWLLLSVGLMQGLPAGEEEATLRGVILQDPALTVTSVLPNSPASMAGLKDGDKVLSVASEGKTIKNPTPEELQNFIAERVGKEIMFSVVRNAEPLVFSIIPKGGIVEDRGAIGISMDTVGTIILPWHKAIYAGGDLTLAYTKMTAVGLYDLFRDAIIGRPDFSGVSGPVGIVKIVGSASEMGVPYLVVLVSLISINLAVVNVLPIPALDGGRLFFLAIETVRGKPLKKRTINLAHMIGFALLMGLIIAVTFHDIWKLFAG